MKTVIALMLGLAASTASFAHSTGNPSNDVVVSSANQKLQVYVAPQPGQATIRFADAAGHILYNRTENAAQGLRQKLNLSELAPGTYHLMVTKAGQVIDKTIVIEDVPAQKQVALTD